MSPSKIRMLIRAAVMTATAFGLHLSADQTVAIYALVEAGSQLFVKGTDGSPE